MKTTHEKLITSLLALGLVGVSPVGAQSQNAFYNASPNGGQAGVIFSSTPNEDLNGNGVRDAGVELDADNDGFLDRFNEGAINESTAGGVDAWNNPIAIDVNGDGVIQTGNYVFDLEEMVSLVMPGRLKMLITMASEMAPPKILASF